MVICIRCGTSVSFDDVSEGYYAVCPNHDEDLYEIETEESNMELTKCLDCGNTSRFIIPFIDRTMVVYNEHGDTVDEYSVGYQSYDDERTICGVEGCGSDNLNIYKEN